MKQRGIVVATLLLSSVAVALGAVAAPALVAFGPTGASAAKSISLGKPEAVLDGATVSLTNFQFAPKVVRIKAGSAVTWEAKEGTHTVTADNGAFESPALSAGNKFSYTFSRPGTYRYYCSFHGSKGGHDMAGTVVVSK